MGAMDRFLEKLYDSTDHCRGSLSGLRDVQERTRVIRRQLEGALGDFGFAHRQPDHHGEQIEHTVLEDYTRERMIFQLGDELSVPVYVLTPRQHPGGPLPAVLALHGHGYGSKEIVGLAPDGSPDSAVPGIHQHFAVQLVRRGMKVFAPELAGFGDRRLARDQDEAQPCS
ncbi:dienelactone hydrolase, partial [Peribacillus sp. NPDC056705]